MSLRALHFALVLVSFVALAPRGLVANEVLTEAMGLAAKGEIHNGVVVGKLKALYAGKTTDPSDRLMAAFLLTHAEPTLVGGSPISFVDYLYTAPGAEKVLGASGMQRVFRLKGDYEYNRGKFDLAIPSYEKLLKVSAAGQRDYAVLKLGWSHLNQDEGGAAFGLWLGEVRDALTAKKAVSQNLLHGLGQALTEKLDRNASDVAAVGALPATEEQRAAVVKGIVDGLNYLTAPAPLEIWVNSFRNATLAEPVARMALESANVKGERACALLGVVVGRPVAFKDAARVVSLCAEGILKGSVTGEKATASLDKALDSLSAGGEERYTRLRFLKFRKRWLDACREGLSWLDDQVGTAKAQAPVAEIASACQQALSGDKSAAAQLVAGVEKRLTPAKDAKPKSEVPVRLATLEEPLSFVVNALLEDAGFLAVLSDSVLRSGVRYSGTIVPTLLAERWVAKGEVERADAVGRAVPNAGAAGSQGVWGEIHYRKIAKLLEAMKLDEAKRLLESDFPVTGTARPSTEAQALWLALSVKALAAPAMPWARNAVSDLLSARREGRLEKLPVGFDPTLWEAASQAGLWKDLWPAIKQAPAFTFPSERFEADLFEAIVVKQITVGEGHLGKALGAMVSAAAPLRDDPALLAYRPGRVWSAYGGRSALAKDLHFVASLSHRAHGSLGRKGDTVAKVTAWVGFLGRAPKEVAARSWACPSLRRAGSAIVAGFCRAAQQDLGKLAQPEGLPATEWQELNASLAERLTECLKVHDHALVAESPAPKNSGAPVPTAGKPKGAAE